MHLKIHIDTGAQSQMCISGRNALSTAAPVTSFEHTLKKLLKDQNKVQFKKKKKILVRV